MSFYLSGGVEVLGFISPTEITDEYPVIDPLYGIDGLRNVNVLSDLNTIPTPRRRPGMIVGVSGGTQYYKLNSPPWNNTISDWSIFNSGGGSFTGGTVTGNTIFTNGLTANTLTVNGILITGDTYTTGGTYSNGTLDFYNNTGGNYQVTGLYTGQTSYVNSLTTGVGLSADTTTGNITIINTDPDQVVTISGGTNVDVSGTYPNFNIGLTGLTDNDRYTTGFTYNNNTFTIEDNSGSTYSAVINSVTGLTVNGNLSASTYQNLPLDIYVTGGTYSVGTIIFTNNTGGTFNVTGLTTTQNLSKILFVDPNGNNSTATKGNSNLPYLTLEAAQSAATIGDTIYVFPGTYTVTTTATEGLAKDGVSYYFMPNTTINKSTAGDIFRVSGFTTGFSVLGYGNFNKTGTAASIFYCTTVASTINIIFEANDLTTTTSSVIFDIRSTGKCFLTFKNASSTAGSVVNLDASTVLINMHSITTTTGPVFIGSSGGLAGHFGNCNLTIYGYLIETTSVSLGVSTLLSSSNNLINLTVNYIRTASSSGYGIASNATSPTRINLSVTRITGLSSTSVTPFTTIYLDGFSDSINGRFNLIGGEVKAINVTGGEIYTTFRGYYDNATPATITVSGGKVVLQMENQDPTTGFNISGGDVTLNGVWTNDDMSTAADLTGGILRMNCDYEYGGPNYIASRYYGIKVNGGTLIITGTIRVNFPSSVGLNSYTSLFASPIEFNSGKIISNGGTLISNISGATAIRATSSGLSLKVYTGGLNTNLVENGGVLVGKKMKIKYTVNSVATTTIVLNDGTGGNETFTETNTTIYNTTALLAQRMVSLINVSGTLDITASQDIPGTDTYFYAESDTANNQYTLVSTTNLTVFAISPGMFPLTQSVLGTIIEDTDIE
jgi:hypothetical protein